MLKKMVLLIALAFPGTLALGQALEIGQPVPPLKLGGVLQGPPANEISWEKLKGNVVVLEFWATWCVPCVAAIPHVNDLAVHFENKPVKFLSITNEDRGKIERFLAKREMKSWIGLDTASSLLKAYHVKLIPRMLVVDREGKLVLDAYPMDVDQKILQSVLDGSYVAEKGPAEAKKGEPGSFDLEAYRNKLAVRAGQDPLYLAYKHYAKEDSGPPYIPSYQHILRRPAFKHESSNWTIHGSEDRKTMASVGITLDAPLSEILVLAYGLPSPLRIVNEAGLDEKEQWEIIYARARDYNLPKAWDEIKQSLTYTLQMQASEVMSERDVLVATVPDHSKIKKSGDIDWKNDPTVRTLVLVQDLIAQLERKSGQIVTFEAGVDWYLDTYGVDYQNLPAPELKSWLESQGLAFKKGAQKVKLLKLTKK